MCQIAQTKPLYLQIYTDFNPWYFQTIKSDRIAPYYELCHLHYKNCIVIFRVRVGCTMSVRLMVIDLIGLGDVIDLSVKPWWNDLSLFIIIGTIILYHEVEWKKGLPVSGHISSSSLTIPSPCFSVHILMGEPPPIFSYCFCILGVLLLAIQAAILLWSINLRNKKQKDN